MESWLFLLGIFVISVLAKNQPLMIASVLVLLIKLVPNSTAIFDFLTKQGMNIGITIISLTILIPIATGEVNFSDLLNALKTPVGVVAVICGILVAILSRHGINLLFGQPEITVALIFGTIVGVVLFKGVAAGPVIAGGMTYIIVSLLSTVGIK
ncbi:DUF441 domain-containing protein [Lactobacillus sp. YT155]|uniref:DUF441 domain-containing protein n=1 Tax=Lactobacillus sp. YT155 TaxID=3060955 RepID=UPI002660570E|nr:DUF441 domain-containing protein [Lactobacillus sp. YT155]MDO1605373.1 DUF441 domain-containing protein [Lactobacillus sp. YT155]